MSKNKFPIIILMLTVMLTGCYPSGGSEQPDKPAANNSTAADSPDSGEVSEPAEFTMPNDLKNVKFSFELGDSYPTEAPVIKTKLRGFDVEEMKAMFIDGKTVIRETSNDDLNVFHTSDGESLVVDKGRVDYRVDHLFDDEEKHNIYDIQSTAANNLRFFYIDYQYLDSELEGFPRSEALERAEELVKKLDIKFLGEPNIYAFTSEDIINVFGKTSFDIEGNELNNNLPKEDEFYLVRYFTEYSGIRIAEEKARVFEDVSTADPQVDIILTKDSLVRFSCDDVFDNIEAVDTTQIKYSAEDIMANIYDHYRIKDSVMPVQLEYDSLDILYVTYEGDYGAGEYTLKPMWHLLGTMYNESRHSDTDKFADPVTGYVYDTGY